MCCLRKVVGQWLPRADWGHTSWAISAWVISSSLGWSSLWCSNGQPDIISGLHCSGSSDLTLLLLFFHRCQPCVTVWQLSTPASAPCTLDRSQLFPLLHLNWSQCLLFRLPNRSTANSIFNELQVLQSENPSSLADIWGYVAANPQSTIEAILCWVQWLGSWRKTLVTLL